MEFYQRYANHGKVAIDMGEEHHAMCRKVKNVSFLEKEEVGFVRTITRDTTRRPNLTLFVCSLHRTTRAYHNRSSKGGEMEAHFI